MSTFLRLAVRNVARNRRRSLITFSALLVGVTAVLVTRGITDGFLRLMVDDMVKGRTGALQIHPAGYVSSIEALPLEPSLTYDEALLARIQAVPGVTGVSGRLIFAGLVSNGVSQTTFVGRGVDPERERQAVPRFGFDVREGGRVLAPGDHARALVGSELARSFHAVPASSRSRRGRWTTSRWRPRAPRGGPTRWTWRWRG